MYHTRVSFVKYLMPNVPIYVYKIGHINTGHAAASCCTVSTVRQSRTRTLERYRGRISNTITETRNPAAARIADRTGCQWPSRSSKIDDFHLIWQDVCHFLWVTLAVSLTVSEIWPVFQYIFYLISIQLSFENVPLAVDRRNFACPCLRHMANYSWRIFPKDLPFSQGTSVTERRTNRQTDDNHANSSTVT